MGGSANISGQNGENDIWSDAGGTGGTRGTTSSPGIAGSNNPDCSTPGESLCPFNGELGIGGRAEPP